MKKRIIIGIIIAAIVGLIGGSIWYIWPIEVEQTFEDVALWYARDGDETISDFVDDCTTIHMSFTRQRRMTLPDSFSGTITIGDNEYTIRTPNAYFTFFQNIRNKWAEDRQPYLEIDAYQYAEPDPNEDLYLPTPEVAVFLYMSRDGQSFYIVVNPTNSAINYVYTYPADTWEEAYAVYSSIWQ